MDNAVLADAVLGAAERERFFLAAVASKTAWPPGGLFLPRALLAAQLEIAAAVLRSLGGATGLIAPGQVVHVRAKVIEHQGDAVLVELPSLRSSTRELIRPSAIAQIEPLSALAW